MANHKRCWFGLALGALLTGGMFISGCGSGKTGDVNDAEVDPKERPFLEAGRPFYEAIAARDYEKAYALLSSHARARMTKNQFDPPDDDTQAAQNQQQPMTGISAEKFASLMGLVEKRYGPPSKVDSLDVFETDPLILAGKGKEAGDAIQSMFAVGAIPDSVPADIRKASLRGHIDVEPRPETLAEAAKARETTVEELKKDPDVRFYFTLKAVLVEDGGELKVGYFEFLPPSMLD